jgi:hypothetical protein
MNVATFAGLFTNAKRIVSLIGVTENRIDTAARLRKIAGDDLLMLDLCRAIDSLDLHLRTAGNTDLEITVKE